MLLWVLTFVCVCEVVSIFVVASMVEDAPIFGTAPSVGVKSMHVNGEEIFQTWLRSLFRRHLESLVTGILLLPVPVPEPDAGMTVSRQSAYTLIMAHGALCLLLVRLIPGCLHLGK